MEDVLGESNESESDSFVNTDSKIGLIYGTFASGGSSSKPGLCEESHFSCLYTCEQ
jgi:hypothetical protein